MINTILKWMVSELSHSRKLKASITVESAFSFTIMVFVLFLMLGPLLIIKSTSDLLLDMNSVSMNRCNYETIKRASNETTIYRKIEEYISDNEFLNENLGKIENIVNYISILYNYNSRYDSEHSEYKNINYIYDMNSEAYDEESGIVKLDYNISFKLPYNLFHIQEVRKRLVINRRAFIGSIGDRFNVEEGEYVYVSNNSSNSHIYHTFADCTYLVKKSISFEYVDKNNYKNENNQRYTKCNYCFKKVKIQDDTLCYATQYGDRFHYRKNCPLITAYIRKIPVEDVERYDLQLCSRCNKRGEKE